MMPSAPLALAAIYVLFLSAQRSQAESGRAVPLKYDLAALLFLAAVTAGLTAAWYGLLWCLS